jgi:hypothetical protein
MECVRGRKVTIILVFECIERIARGVVGRLRDRLGGGAVNKN